MLEAANGKFAKPFYLFIIDYSTPSEGGFNYVKELRNNQKIIKQPKIIMLLPMKREDLFDRLSDYRLGLIVSTLIGLVVSIA